MVPLPNELKRNASPWVIRPFFRFSFFVFRFSFFVFRFSFFVFRFSFFVFFPPSTVCRLPSHSPRRGGCAEGGGRSGRRVGRAFLPGRRNRDARSSAQPRRPRKKEWLPARGWRRCRSRPGTGSWLCR